MTIEDAHEPMSDDGADARPDKDWFARQAKRTAEDVKELPDWLRSGADARRVAPVEPLRQLIAEMHTMSDGIDNANNHTDYQVRLIALGLTAREFLRRHRALEAQRVAAPPEGTLPKRDVRELVEALRIRALAVTGEAWEREATRAMMNEAAQMLEDMEVRAAVGVHP